LVKLEKHQIWWFLPPTSTTVTQYPAIYCYRKSSFKLKLFTSSLHLYTLRKHKVFKSDLTVTLIAYSEVVDREIQQNSEQGHKFLHFGMVLMRMDLPVLQSIYFRTNWILYH